MLKSILLVICLLFFTQYFSLAQIKPNGASVPTAQTVQPIPAAYVNTNSSINYVRTWEPRRPLLDTGTIEAQSATDVLMASSYIDGIGRVIQTVNRQLSPQLKDVVNPVVFDNYGRESLKYLPYKSISNDGNFKINPFLDQQSYYTSISNEQVYYSQSVFEASPLGRVTKSLAPGNSWAGSNRGVSVETTSNGDSDLVRLWTIADAIGSIPISSAVYGKGQLYKTITTDEAGKQVIEYKDKEGLVILKKVQLADLPSVNHTGWLCTYYVYDYYNLLRCVIQPVAVETMANASNWNLSTQTTLLNEMCFRYEYDSRNRMIIKKVPGAGEVWMVYDKLDRLVMTQDQNLRDQGKWQYTLYDALERPYSTGLWTNSSNRVTHQGLADASTNYPTLSGTYEELTTTFYDNYTYANVKGFDNSYTSLVNPGTNLYSETPDDWKLTTGLVTGSRVKVLGTTSTMLLTTTYYDNKGRVIQTLSDNVSGGVDISTSQYDFSGKLLSNYLRHQNPLSLTTPQIKVLTKNTYDHAGRTTKITRQINDDGVDHLIATSEYDELGQLIKKKIGTKPGTSTTPLDSISYDYNLRGWLSGINKNYVQSNGKINYFGEVLSYDYGFSSNQYTGNIAGVQWRSRGDDEGRAFGYGYDNVNRLLKGDFTQYTASTSAWTTPGYMDFSMKMGDGVSATTAYDANGNIKKMFQKGWKFGGTITIDDLTYNYQPNSNKLNYVRDGSNDANSILGDFKESTQNNSDNLNLSSADYTYDGNGNLIVDNNKSISSITYNYLNLPSLITVTGKGTIAYTYDAGGNKLKKITTEGSKVTTISYLGGFIYQRTSSTGSTADTLQFFNHEEGRIRYTPALGAAASHFDLDFMEKDHLGNVRIVLTEEVQQDIYPAATLEGSINTSTDAIYVEKNYYSIIPAYVVNSSTASGITAYPNNNGIPNNNPNSNTTANSTKVYQLNANTNKLGLGITLKVMAGDILSIYGKSYYLVSGSVPGTSSAVPLLDLLTAFAGSPGMAGKGVTGSGLNALSEVTNGLTSLLNSQGAQTSSQPKAYLNWIFFDERFNYVDGGFDRVGSSGVVKSHSKLGLEVPKSGYVFIYCSNESQLNVFFDNLQVMHDRGRISEENHYYPFGLTMVGISNRALNGAPENKFKYNNGSELQSKEFSDGSGLEMYNTEFRSLDPQTGRWWQIDPKPDMKMTPYSSMQNNPIYFNDPLGDTVVLPNASDEFKKQFAEATSTLIASGVGDLYIAAVESTSMINVLETKDGNSSYDPKTMTISWNPNMGVAVDNGDMSATAVLNHELDHTVQHDKNPKQFKIDSNKPDKNYGDKEEARVIKGSEQQTAQALKELPAGISTRTNHKAQPYPTTKVTSNKPLVQQQLEDKKNIPKVQ